MSAAANIRIEAINSPQEFEEFARLPYEVYADREAWWPPDIQNEIDLLNGRTPIAAHLDLQPFAAWRNGRIVARVTAVINHRYNQHWQEGIGPGPHPLETAMAIEDVRASAGAVCAASPSYMEINAKVIAEMQALMAELKVLGL